MAKPTGETKPNSYKDGSIVKDEEPGLPINVPLSILRWLSYSVLFGLLLGWLVHRIGPWPVASISLILGHFASQLNALIKKP